jgi:hypothetical protein
MKQFNRDGIHFTYPESWQLECEDGDHGWTVLVQSPETAFMLLSFDSDSPEMEQMAQTALQALREDYPDLEADDQIGTLAGQPALGHDIRFFSFDLTNTCWTRSFFAPGGTVLAMYQFTDQEAEKYEPLLKAMCASLRIEED